MTVEPDLGGLRRSPLAHRGADLAAASGPGVTLAELPFLSMTNVRVAPGSTAADRVGAVVSVALPKPGREANSGATSVLGLGPDEFLVVAERPGPAELAARLDAAVGAGPGSVVDVSAHRTTIVVGGPRARDLLEKGCTLDLHPRAFTAGHCAQTTFARGHLLIWPTADGDRPSYRLLVRSSFAGYFADWLIDAAIEYGSNRLGKLGGGS